MNLTTIMIIALTSGDEVALLFKSQRDCGDALPKMPQIEVALNIDVDSAICLPTLAPSTSPIPRPKPEAI